MNFINHDTYYDYAFIVELKVEPYIQVAQYLSLNKAKLPEEGKVDMALLYRFLI